MLLLVVNFLPPLNPKGDIWQPSGLFNESRNIEVEAKSVTNIVRLFTRGDVFKIVPPGSFSVQLHRDIRQTEHFNKKTRT